MIVTTTEFGLESKKIIFVTDNGSNIVKACRLAGVERMGCIAHGAHNLITVDGMSKSSSLTRIVNDVKGIVHVFVYKTQLLEEEGRKMVHEHLIDRIAGDGEDVHVENIDYDYDVDVGDEADGAAVSLAEGQRAGSQYTTTVKKECPTLRGGDLSENLWGSWEMLASGTAEPGARSAPVRGRRPSGGGCGRGSSPAAKGSGV
jgi:hypothetical protein